MLCKVNRSFGGPDNTMLEIGSIVDTADWPRRNRTSLIERRYLEPIGRGDLPPDVTFETQDPPRRGPGRPPKHRED